MATIVYVSNADSGALSVLRLDARGALTPQQTVQVGGTVMPLAVSPERRFLYAARRSEPFSLASLRIGPDGSLASLGDAPLPASMAYLATDRTGRFLFSASYPGNLIAVSPIGADGIAQAPVQLLPTGPHAHAIQADPSNRWVFATVLGADEVLQLRFDAARGRLQPATAPLRTRRGAGPRHLVFHPNGRLAYLLNELDASIDVLAFDGDRGTLAPLQAVNCLPPGFSGEPWAADLHLTPDGRFLYASERRSSTLAVFRVAQPDGTLTLVQHVPAETQPRGFAIDPAGRYLVTAGQLSHRIGVHAIDAASGTLTALDATAVGRNPNWVEIIDLQTE